MSLGTAIVTKQLAQKLMRLDGDDIMSVVGLRRRRSHWADALGLLGLGAVVGAGSALLFAPASGTQTRERLSRELDKLGKAASDITHEIAHEAQPWLAQLAGEPEERPLHG